MSHTNATQPEITVTLPPVYFPLPLEVHPQVEALEERGIAWMTRHGFCADPVLRSRVIDSKAAHFFGYLCPKADPQRLQMAVDWGYLMFVFDDFHCDGDTSGDNFGFLDLAVRFVRTLEAPTACVLNPEHPFTAPVLDLAKRLHCMATPSQVRRQVDAHLLWLLGVAWEIPVIGRHLKQSLNDYVFTRLMYVAGAPTLTWFQISEPDEVPDVELNSQRVRALTEMAGAVATFDDDLYSYGKDQWVARHRLDSDRPFDSNLMSIYITQYGLTADEALNACAVLRDRILARFVELRAQVLPDASPPLARYLYNLTCLIRGNYEWGMMAGRYSNPDGKSPGAIRTIGNIADTPAATGPPGIPAIDWWWSE